MIEKIIRIILRFFVLVLVQVLILNNIQLGGYVNPYMYVLFILLLPMETPKSLLLLLAFVLGLTIDMFTNTMGMHAGACVFMAYCRPYVTKVISPRDGYDMDTTPTIQNLGLNWFSTYSIILVLLHHFVLFYLEVFRLHEFFSTFFRIIFSSILTVSLILLSQYLFYKTRSEK